jgi:tetratricopeptide (TPR) repeat protein
MRDNNPMTPSQVEEHNRAFERAIEIAREEILTQGVPKTSKPSSLFRSRLDLALQLLLRVIELNPNNWSAMWFVGKIHQRRNDHAMALEWFARAHDSNPPQVDVSREASISAMALGRSQEAISYASKALSSRPNDSGLQSNLALAYLLADNLDEAKRFVEKAMVRGPIDPIAKTISKMIDHFVKSQQTPPSTTEELEKYWTLRRLS